MKTRLLSALVGFAIGFAWPIFAQEKEEVKPFPFTPIPCWSSTSPANRSDQSAV